MKKLAALFATLPLALVLATSAHATTAKKRSTRKKATPGPHRYYGDIRSEGGSYVFVTRGKALKINNQDFAGLKDAAGKHVRLMCTRRNDAVTISSLAVIKPRPRRKTKAMKK